jgi:hypothetical protein
MRAVRNDRLSAAPSDRTIRFAIKADSPSGSNVASQLEESVMNAVPKCFRGSVVAASFFLSFPFAAVASDTVPPEALNVKVFPDRYVAAGRPFADLASLDAWAKSIRIRTVWLDGCGNAAGRQLIAAVERFYPLYTEGVQVRVLGPADPGCLAPVAVDITQVRALPAAAEYLVTDRAGRSALP